MVTCKLPLQCSLRRWTHRANPNQLLFRSQSQFTTFQKELMRHIAMLINTADADGSGANNGQLGAFQETLSIHFNRYICRPNDSISQENQSTGRMEFGLVQQSMLTQ